MGMRNGQTQVANHAPEGTSGSDLSDFENAFGGMFEGNQQNEAAQERFSQADADEVEETEELEEASAPIEHERKLEHDPLDGIEQKRLQAREKFKLQRENKDLKERLERLERGFQEKESKPSGNPFKGLKPDDIVQQALAAMESDGYSEEEAKKEMKTMSPEEIIAKAKEELRRELQEERQKEVEKSSESQAVDNFKRKIEQFTTQAAEAYPLVGALGGIDHVYSMIESDYMNNENEFGTEYAMENMLSIEAATKKVNQMLAQEVKNALKSNHMRKFILAAIKEDGGKNESSDQSDEFNQLEESIGTLTNSVHKRVTDPRDIRTMTDDEALEQSFAYLSN